MSLNRREFLGLGSTLLATSASVPTFLKQTAWAAAGQEPTSDRVLVVLQLTGGNDGLNTVVPFTNETYRKLRPKLQLADAKLHRLNDRLGLHPSLKQLKSLIDEDQAALIQSVGYPNPNRSHFESMAIWHAAPVDKKLNYKKSAYTRGGWLARAIDQRSTTAQQTESPQALNIGAGEMPKALLGSRVQVPSIQSLAQLKQNTGLFDQKTQQAQIAAWKNGAGSTSNPLLQAALQSSLAVHTTAEQIRKINPDQSTTVKYPENALAERLQLIAQLIRAGFSTPVYYTEHTGFDTHSQQLNSHRNVLGVLGRALRAFITDVNKHVPNRPVLVLVFSEFGRRVEENGSAGTDHGTAGPVFLAGSHLKPGVHGPDPDLENLVDDDPVFGVDFRSVYATILEDWLNIPSQPVLGQQFDKLDFLKTT
ncbi:DUF1501 domain-containing protein [Gimesia fumaroli]|uniref:DUF1501 domain-containing protein n=1 Tax=Gimesia fumaroli TaxID=2527976 RepID=A0A518IJP5_9PLAN|nr:DUF1501 domain-containing protein [Gimesia fumaroli]QDV53316.1 hypothetical protein Enr17x_53900 [Gimesia fumaroli]